VFNTCKNSSTYPLFFFHLQSSIEFNIWQINETCVLFPKADMQLVFQLVLRREEIHTSAQRHLFNQEIARNSVVHLRENAEINMKKEIYTYYNMLVTHWPPVILSCTVSAMVQLVFNNFIRDKNFKTQVQKISTIRYPLIDPVLKRCFIKVTEKIQSDLKFNEDIINKRPTNIPLCFNFTKFSFHMSRIN
jgi:hypothetical protein